MIHDRSVVLADLALGNKQKLTPEKFLLCEDVPIARIGIQQYLDQELPEIEPAGDGVLHIERRAEDVFHDDTIRSFEGKPVVDDHPEEGTVTPENYKKFTVGVTLNPRRGEGAWNDLLIADLLIKDADAIAAVRAGKREVSCGYDAQYEQLAPGRARQHSIIGNHVALVNRGRCGTRCAIGDHEMKTTDKKGVSWLDKAKAAFFSKDEKAFTDAMKEAEESKDEESSHLGTASTIHLHMGPNESTTLAPTTDKGKKSKDRQDPENEEEEESSHSKDSAPKWFKDFASQNLKSMDTIAKALDRMTVKDKAKKDSEEEMGEEEAEGNVMDAEEEEEEKEEKAKDKKKTKDSAGYRDEFQAVRAGCEILAPGIKMGTFDAAADKKAVGNTMCLMRRKALAAHAHTTDGAQAIFELTQEPTLKLQGMTCDAVKTLFNGAVAFAKQQNNGGNINLSSIARDGNTAVPRSAADFNKAKNKLFV